MEELKEIFIYMIICKFSDYKFIKIGKSVDLYMRVQNIKTGCPHEITDLFVLQYEYNILLDGFERLLHRMLSESKLKGEWFLLNDIFIERFQQLLIMISENKILDNNFDFLNEVSMDEAEILMHTHKLNFAKVSLPIKKDKKFTSTNMSINQLIKLLNNM